MASSTAASRPKAIKQAQTHPNRLWPLMLGAIGVVYGDIGTSPIYAFKEAAIAATGEAQVTPVTVLGILSLIVWSLLLLVTLKYVLVLLRADYNGEGGTFALMALAQSAAQHNRQLILLLGIAGAAFLYGDVAITPALSVVSAVEGLTVIAPAFEIMVVPVSIAILVGLFAVQSRGTGKVGTFFGPVLLVWFITLAAVGVVCIAEHPGVLDLVEVAAHGRQRGAIVARSRGAGRAASPARLSSEGMPRITASWKGDGRAPSARRWQRAWRPRRRRDPSRGGGSAPGSRYGQAGR